MKKIFLSVLAFVAITGCSNSLTKEDALKKKITDLEKQVAMLKKKAGLFNFKYFDNLSGFRQFVVKNYAAKTYNYNTVAINTNNLRTSLQSFPQNSLVYLSIVYTPDGRELLLNNETFICNPPLTEVYDPTVASVGRPGIDPDSATTLRIVPRRGFCCPPNCPPKPLIIPKINLKWSPEAKPLNTDNEEIINEGDVEIKNNY